VKKHIELDRRFYRLAEDADAFPEDTTHFGDSEYVTEGWEKLLTRRRVVVLAEAGMGKTEELRTRAEKLLEAGKPAFHGRVDRLADGDFGKALERGDATKIAPWRDGDGVAYFFLDSVDEARLTNKKFRDALRTVAETIRGTEERAHIFISSRPSDWQWDDDLAIIHEVLPVQSGSSNESEEPPPLSDDALLAPVREKRRRSRENRKDDEADKIAVVQLLGLSRSKIERFARESGVKDVPAFMRALADADAMSLVARPQDLDGIVKIWVKTGRIGTHSQALRNSIEQRIKETNRDQAQLRELSETQALQGAQRIAAALTLGQAATVAVPGEEQEREGALDTTVILRDWTAKQRMSLISRGIFDPATYGRVRFHHREVQEFLTAEWLLERMRKGCAQEKIEELILTEKHGFTVVRPTSRAVAAWVGQQHEGIRKRLLKDAPEVLIEAGDPSLMPVEARIEFLRRFADRYRGRKDNGVSINLDNVRHFVDPGLTGAIEELWREHTGSEEVRELLLRLIWQGGLQGNAGIPEEVLRSSTSSEYERSVALKALAAAGSADQQRASVALSVEKSAEWGARVSDAIEAFYPETMSDMQLVQLLEAVDVPESKRGTGLDWVLREVASRVPRPIVHRMLHAVMPLIRREPYRNGEVRVSQRYGWLLDPVARMCERLLPEAGGAPDEVLSEAVEALGRNAFWHSDIHVETKELSTVLADTQLTRHFFWRSVEHGIERLRKKGIAFEGYWQLYGDHPLWRLKESDLDWLIGDVRSKTDVDTRKAALTAALQVWNSFGRDASTLAVLHEGAGSNDVLLQCLDAYLNPTPRQLTEEEVQRRARLEELEREHEENRSAGEQSWLDFREELKRKPEVLSDKEAVAACSNFGKLSAITRWLNLKRDDHARYSIGEWELLEPAFGRPVAEAARDGLSAFWRTVDCEAEVRSDRTTNGTIVALAGVAMDARRPGWAASLTDEEARRAMKLALKELNGVPHWVAGLLEHKAAAVADVVRPLIANELGLEPGATDSLRVLERLQYAEPVVRDQLPPLVLDQLEQHDPQRPETLRRALQILLASPSLDRKRLAELARARIAANHNDRGMQQLWLTALLCVDGATGISELRRCVEGLMSSDADEFMLALLNTLYEHRGAAFGEAHTDFLEPSHLLPFITLVLSHVRYDEDRHHEGHYTPDERDEAEHVRGKLLERFTSIPGRQTVDTLLSLRDRPEWAYLRERLLIWAERRAAADGDLKRWEPSDVVQFEERFERPVGSSNDLYEVAYSRLASLKYELEHDDFSNRDLLRQDERDRALEESVQLWFAREFRHAARGQYTVHREEEVIDGDKPDIRLASQKADAPTSIEIKVADSWKYEELVEALEDQLVGRYMRAERSRHGVLLMTWHGKEPTWSDGKDELTFPQVVERLSKKASELRASNREIDGLSVVGIDLTAGRPTTKKKKGSRRAPKKREAK
jgi:hypothetical protein